MQGLGVRGRIAVAVGARDARPQDPDQKEIKNNHTAMEPCDPHVVIWKECDLELQQQQNWSESERDNRDDLKQQ